MTTGLEATPVEREAWKGHQVGPPSEYGGRGLRNYSNEGSFTGWLQPGFVQIAATQIRWALRCWIPQLDGLTLNLEAISAFRISPLFPDSLLPTSSPSLYITGFPTAGPCPRPTEPESVFEPNPTMTQVQWSLGGKLEDCKLDAWAQGGIYHAGCSDPEA